MTSVNLEKALEYFTIQESLWYENLSQSIIYENFYKLFSTLKDIIEAQSETNP